MKTNDVSSVLFAHWRSAFRDGLCILVFLSVSQVFGQTLDFTIDAKSPETYSPAEIRVSDGSDTRIPHTDLGVVFAEDVNALSYGDAEVEPLGLYNYVRLAYSVDCTSVGASGQIPRQVALNGAAGDKFGVDIVGFRGNLIVIRQPYLISDAPVHNLTPKPDESELDGLAWKKPGAGLFPVYVTFPPGGARDPATIYIVRTAGASPEVFATPGDLGLEAGDIIDALAVGTNPTGLPRPHGLGPEVVIWISLARGSPTRSLVEARGGDGILQVYPTEPLVAFDAKSLGITPEDEIDAVTALDPSPNKVGIPEKLPEIESKKTVTVETTDGSTYKIDLIFGQSPRGESAFLNVGRIDSSGRLACGGSTEIFHDGPTGSIAGVVPIDVTARATGDPDAPVELLVALLLQTNRITPDGGASGIDVFPGYVLLRYNVTDACEVNHTGVQQFGESVQDFSLWGDFFIVDPATDLSRGEPLVHIEGSGNSPTIGGMAYPRTRNLPDAYFWVTDWVGGVAGNPCGFQGQEAQAMATAAIDLRVPGNERVLVVASMSLSNTDSRGQFAHLYPLTPTGRGEEILSEKLSTTSSLFPKRATLLIFYEVDLTTKAVTLHSVYPIISTSALRVEVAAIELTEDGAVIGLNFETSFTTEDGSFGVKDRTGASLLKFGGTGDPDWYKNPTVTHAFRTSETTETPLDFTPKIRAMKLGPADGDGRRKLGVVMNLIRGNQAFGSEPLSLDFVNAANGDSVRLTFTESFGLKGTFFDVDWDSFEIGDCVVDAVPGSRDVPNNSQLGFTAVTCVNGRWCVTGFTRASDGVLQPGNIAVDYESGGAFPSQGFYFAVGPGQAAVPDTDNDGVPDVIEEYFGTGSTDPGSRPTLTPARLGDGRLRVTYFRSSTTSASPTVRFTKDFESIMDGSATETGNVAPDGGIEMEAVSPPADGVMFFFLFF